MKRIIGIVFFLYSLMILIRIVSSWFPQWAGHPFIRFIAQCTDPYLNFFRKFIPAVGSIDFSPVVGLLVLQIVQWLLILLL